MAFPENSQLTSGTMEDTELDDGFVQVKEKLGNSNEMTSMLGDSDPTGNGVSFTDQLETNSGPGIREPSDMDWSGNSGQSNLNVERATSNRLSKDRESDQYELLEEDVSEHNNPSKQLRSEAPRQARKEGARVVRRLQRPKSKLLHTTKPEDEDHLKGLWKCKVATALDKDMQLKLARCFGIEASLLEGSPVPGLKLLEQIEKKDCQGYNWEAFAEALTDCGCLKALATFNEHYKGPPPASVNHKPVSFQHMVADVEGMLNTSDAVQIATCFGFNVSEIEETEKHGSQFVIKLLQAKEKFGVRNVTLFRKVLKTLDLIQAANTVSQYEVHLKLPVLKVTLDEASSSDESRCYFDHVTKALTDETERMDDKEPTAKLMHHVQENYDMPVEDIEKGSIILSLRVKTKKSLERLKSDVKSGKFAKDCSKILFPNADNLYSIKDEICLRATCAVQEFERVYQELKRIENQPVDAMRTSARGNEEEHEMQDSTTDEAEHLEDVDTYIGTEDEQQEQLVTVVVADDGAEQEKTEVLKVTLDEASSSDESRCYFDDVTTALTDETERMDDKEPTAKLMHHLQGTYDMPLEDIGKGSIILSLRVKTKKSLERLKSDVKSGKFSKDCSRILSPYADKLYGTNGEICLRATFAVEEFERVYQELKRIENQPVDAMRTSARGNEEEHEMQDSTTDEAEHLEDVDTNIRIVVSRFDEQEQLVTVVVADDGAEQEKTEVKQPEKRAPLRKEDEVPPKKKKGAMTSQDSAVERKKPCLQDESVDVKDLQMTSQDSAVERKKPCLQDESVDVKDLQDIALQIANDRNTVAANLGFEAHEIDIMEADCDRASKGGITETAFQMLLRWKRKNGQQATKRILIKALKKSEFLNVAEELERKI